MVSSIRRPAVSPLRPTARRRSQSTAGNSSCALEDMSFGLGRRGGTSRQKQRAHRHEGMALYTDIEHLSPPSEWHAQFDEKNTNNSIGKYWSAQISQLLLTVMIAWKRSGKRELRWEGEAEPDRCHRVSQGCREG